RPAARGAEDEADAVGVESQAEADTTVGARLALHREHLPAGGAASLSPCRGACLVGPAGAAYPRDRGARALRGGGGGGEHGPQAGRDGADLRREERGAGAADRQGDRLTEEQGRAGKGPRPAPHGEDLLSPIGR